MKIGFIGFGNMGQAIARGLTEYGGVDRAEVYACAKNRDRLRENAERLGINAVDSPEQTAQLCDIIIPAVIPAAAAEALGPAAEKLRGKLVFSIMAGYDFERLEGLLPGSLHISTIPNTPISVGEGVLICEDRHSLGAEGWEIFNSLFSPIALIEQVSAGQFSIGGTIGGCAPAFTAMYIEALADAAVKHGMTRQAACRIAAQMAIGTGRLCIESGENPAALKDRVCSPGGTTIRGVAALEKRGFRGAVIEAVDAIEG